MPTTPQGHSYSIAQGSYHVRPGTVHWYTGTPAHEFDVPRRIIGTVIPHGREYVAYTLAGGNVGQYRRQGEAVDALIARLAAPTSG